MGVTSKDVALLAALRNRGVSFDRTLMIGRQSLLTDAAGVIAGFTEAGHPARETEAEQAVAGSGGYVEPVLALLGAQVADSIDASPYEASTHVHDMNEPLPAALEQRYSLVFDGGSIEHIFNVGQVLKNCMNAVEVGGHLLSVTTCNNYVGHGFYQFSPEFFFRALQPENGFEVRVVLVRAVHRWGRWLVVRDPREVGRRVELSNSWPTLIYALARRTSSVSDWPAWPQQSDYAEQWRTGQRTRRLRLSDRLPSPARRAATVARTVIGTRSGPGHFKTVNLRELRID